MRLGCGSTGRESALKANDRLRAPNTDEGFLALRRVVATVAQRLFVDREIIVERVENDR
jgi:hypothetical protein